MESKIYDIGIIGAGPAGMTAAIYAGRAGKSVVIIDKDGFGGNIAKSPKVENIPGFVSISGIDFATNMYEQMSNYENIEHVMDEIIFIDYRHGLIILRSDTSQYCCKSLIFATGTQYKELKLPTPNVYYCATCDGPFFKNKNVLVVGSGSTGATYALELANYCKHVYLCDVSMNMFCEPILRERVLANDKISWLPNTSVKSVKNDKNGNLTSVELSNSSVINVKAIFAAIGVTPKTDIAKVFTKRNEAGYIIVSDTMSTVVPGVFAAGDCTSTLIRQVTTACGEGTVAAINAIKFLEDK